MPDAMKHQPSIWDSLLAGGPIVLERTEEGIKVTAVDEYWDYDIRPLNLDALAEEGFYADDYASTFPRIASDPWPHNPDREPEPF